MIFGGGRFKPWGVPIQIDLGSSSPRKAPEAKGLIVGIDLGTTNSLVAYARDGRPEVLKGENGETLLPSVLEIDASGKARQIGQGAKALRGSRPEDVLFSVKRLMGRTLKDISEDARRQIPYELVDDVASHQVKVKVGDRLLSPIEISAQILRALKERAEKALGQKVDRAVITVPAYFDDAQRTATKAAGRIAGLEVLRVFNEPTAAALGYGWSFEKPGTIAVFDLGGGTFDVSILRLEAAVLEVLATSGDTQLGGDDFDAALAEAAWNAFHASGLDLDTLDAAQQRHLRAEILAAAEEAKIRLGDVTTTEIRLGPAWFAGGASADKASFTITREAAEKLWAPLVDRAIERCRSALADAKLAPADLDDVVLVGGSTRLAYVQRRVEDFFGRKPNRTLHPDEAVALGAAVQADVLAGGTTDVVLIDVVPLSLGLETMGGVVEKLIPRNSTIPCGATQTFTTYADNQTGFDLHVLQGERETADACRSLARFTLRGVPPMVAGAARVEISFQVDADGILHVAAHEQMSGVAATIQVKPSYGLTDEEVERMLLESFDHAEEDLAERNLRIERIEADRILAATRAAMEKDARLLDADVEAATRAAMADLERLVAGTDHVAIRHGIEALDRASKPFAERRMNLAVEAAMKGKSIDEVERDLPAHPEVR